MLTDPARGNMKPLRALCFNCLSGLSVLIGAIVLLAADSVSSVTLGRFLAFSGGVYLHIGATECMPRAYEHAKSAQLKLVALIAFVIGAVTIGVVLNYHEHCSAPTTTGAAAAGAHAGHNH